jgi:hypothetical protein
MKRCGHSLAGSADGGILEIRMQQALCQCISVLELHLHVLCTFHSATSI